MATKKSKECKATNKSIYFTKEMCEALEILSNDTGASTGKIIRDALFALLVSKGLKSTEKPVSVFSGMSIEDLTNGSELDGIENRLLIIEQKLGLIKEDGKRTILLDNN